MEEFLKNMELDSGDTNFINSSTSDRPINKNVRKSYVGERQSEDSLKLGASRSTSITRSPTNSPTGTIPLPSTSNSKKPHPGQCFIFNQVNFDDKEKLPTRTGSDKDMESLRETFKRFKLEVFEYRNPTLDTITNQIKEIKKTDYSVYACLVIVILSHGERKEKIYAYDEEFSLDDDIVNPIIKNPTLKGKPKLFFIQTCKGDMTIKQTDSDGSDNILKCYSTFEGYFSYRDPTFGTFFIKALCENLNQNGTSKPIEDIMEDVRNTVKLETDGAQIPSITHTMLMQFSFGDAI